MQQWRSGEVVIDECRRRSKAPNSEPQEDELRRVHEVESHNLPGSDRIVVLEPCRIFQDGLVHLPIGPFRAFEYEERMVGRRLGLGMVLERVEMVDLVRFL